MPDGRNQVGQGFTRTRARLNGEVALGFQGLGYRVSHANLALAAGAAERIHRRA